MDFVKLTDRLKEYFRGSDVGIEIYDLIDSTNTAAKLYATTAGDTSPRLFIAREQSGGRGRLGRSFVSRCNGGIYMSILYFTQDSLCDTVTVTTSCALTVSEALERATGEDMRIKWVNDIYNTLGKVCGILTESVRTEHGYAIIVGIGINVGREDFPPELDGIAASVGDLDEDMLVRAVTEIVDGVLEHGKHHSDRTYMEGYRKRLMLVGEKVELCSGGRHVESGRVCGVDDEGGLLLLVDGKSEPEVFHSGEISIKLG